MKKIYITLLFLLVSLATFSQNSGEIEFGFFGGVSISNVSTVDNQLQSKSRVGFNGGFFGDYFFSETWSLKGKVFYNQNGWEEDISGSLSRFGSDITYTLHYISVALKPSWHFGKSKNWYLNLGPYISFLAGANADTTQVKDSFNSTDVGLESDIGIKF
ncbi:MAG: porin family protein, partial [Bacteroidota bacterium]